MYPWAELRLLLLSSSLAVVLKTIQLITSMDVWQTSKICWKWTFFFFGLICSDSLSASRLGCIKCFKKVRGIFKKPTHLQRKEKTTLEYVRNCSVNILYSITKTNFFTSTKNSLPKIRCALDVPDYPKNSEVRKKNRSRNRQCNSINTPGFQKQFTAALSKKSPNLIPKICKIKNIACLFAFCLFVVCLLLFVWSGLWTIFWFWHTLQQCEWTEDVDWKRSLNDSLTCKENKNHHQVQHAIA